MKASKWYITLRKANGAFCATFFESGTPIATATASSAQEALKLAKYKAGTHTALHFPTWILPN